MAPSLGRAVATTPDKSPVIPRPSMAKANILGQGEPEALSTVVTSAAKCTYGKQGAAAAQLGKDEGNFSRDLKAGRTTIADLSKLGPSFLAEFGKELVEQYAPLSTPQARAKQQITIARRALDELEQVVEHLA